LATGEVLQRLNTSVEGLNEKDAAARLEIHGKNLLPLTSRRSAVLRFLVQFHNPLIYVLMAASLLAGIQNHLTDALVIASVVLANAVIGFVQEGRAEQALDSIRALIDPRASVVRSGRRATIAAADIVPGDIVFLEAGDRVAADIRLVSARNLRIDEAALTGESVPADKAVPEVAVNAPLGDRTSMAYAGTFVSSGQGLGAVVATATSTELGRISKMVGAVERLTTPLVRQMDQFARYIGAGVLAISALVFAFAVFWRAYPIDEALMVVIGLAVAAIPEGLPAVMTVTLAVGVQKMARRNAIIRRLPVVETLGSVSTICSDKTGTLTRNEMTARTVVLADGRISVSGAGYAPEGSFQRDRAAIDPSERSLNALLRAGLLCNDARLRHSDNTWVVDGDPMEGALVSLAVKGGLDVTAERTGHPRRDEIPFDARHRYMATLHAADGNSGILFVKGAPEQILAMCDDVAAADRTLPLHMAYWRSEIESAAADGQRVLALARRSLPRDTERIAPDSAESGLTLLGLVGFIDPPRPEAIAAVAECRTAGIDVKMITGDHVATARTVAIQLGLSRNPKAVTGSELDELSDADFLTEARTATIFARSTPEHKLRLMEALQSDGSIIAMTGDGVNDAPALKRADVGVAMGNKGTEAAKEASEMILADDNFASIVAAIREGRTVYDNITKVIAWTLPTNGGEALTIILAVLFGLVLPVTPVQILWVNTVTAVALGLTLAFEPTEPGTMNRPPRPPHSPLMSGILLWRVFFVSALIAAGAFGIYEFAIARGNDIDTARTMSVNALVVMETFYLFSVRYVHGTSLTWRGILGTRAVLIGVAGVTAAQFAFTYLPIMQSIFGSRPIVILDGFAVIGTGAVMLLLVELEKQLSARLGFGIARA